MKSETYRCEECNYSTPRRTNLRRHAETMHSRASPDSNLECCGEKFLTKAALRFHVREAHLFGYTCVECGRVFCRRALLKRHVSVHSGAKEFECAYCHYATSYKSNLGRHMRSPPSVNSHSSLASSSPSSSLSDSRSPSPPSSSKPPSMSFRGDYSKDTKLPSKKRMIATPFRCRVCRLRWSTEQELISHKCDALYCQHLNK
ncbi:zinc finger Y-chromosomal protein 2-like [Diadema antillarum]|uniref:zinc finger Y-chromosomal protein 2-like n=1 Tax=Diadema antillarum TaxID=105358 RepID=UPI003A88FC8B